MVFNLMEQKSRREYQRACKSSKYRWTEVRSELLLELLSSFSICLLHFPCFEFFLELFNGIGPLDGFCFLVVISNKVCNSLFQGLETLEVIGLQPLALQNAKPDLDLIQPGSIGW